MGLPQNYKQGWRKISGFEKYRVTCRGEVFIAASGKQISQALNVDKYFRVALWKGGRRYRFFVHRLVAIHFKRNPHPILYDQVNHLDWDRLNNRSSNLQWCTASMNVLHAKSRPVFHGVGERGADDPF